MDLTDGTTFVEVSTVYARHLRVRPNDNDLFQLLEYHMNTILIFYRGMSSRNDFIAILLREKKGKLKESLPISMNLIKSTNLKCNMALNRIRVYW